MKGLTEYAQTVLEELAKLGLSSMFLFGDARYRHDKLAGEAKSKNADYIESASRNLGIYQLTRSVDLYNWYCREVLKLAVKSNPDEVIATLEAVDGPIKKNITRARKDGGIPGPEIVEGLYHRRNVMDGHVRRAVHEHLHVFENPETKVLCACRNCLVHKRGNDSDRGIADALNEIGDARALIYPTNWPAGHLPIQLSAENELIIDSEIGRWAVDLISNQIHLMDQNFAALHKLPTTRWRPRPFSHVVTA